MEYTGTLASVLLPAEAKKNQSLSLLCNCSKICVLHAAQSAHNRSHKHDRIDQHNNSLPLPVDIDPNECKIFIHNFDGTDNAALSQSS